MPTPSRAKSPTELPDLHWLITDDGSLTLWSESIDETYHSGCGAVAESLVVYLANSGVLGRLSEGAPTRVFELGFGTGTAFLLTAAIAERFEAPLEFWAIENRPLPPSILGQLSIDRWLKSSLSDNDLRTSRDQRIAAEDFESLPRLQQQLIDQWPKELADDHSAIGQNNAFEPIDFELMLGNSTKLHLVIADATTVNIQRDYPQLFEQFESVYFDAFSPETTPHLWTSEVLTQMHDLLTDGGSLTSYCVKSSIRKILEQLGFSVARLPGPVGGKREVLKAVRGPSIAAGHPCEPAS